MKKVMIIGLLLAIVVVAAWALVSGRSHPTPPQTKKMADGALLLDVRTNEEYQEKHGEKALNIPLTNIQAGVLPQVTQDTPIYVYCRSGNRSAQAVELLKKAGYTKVTDIGAYDNLAVYGVETAKMQPVNNGALTVPQ